MTKQENIYNVYNKGSITTYQQENVGKWEKSNQITKEQTKDNKYEGKKFNFISKKWELE